MYEKKFTEVQGRRMAYVEAGSGAPLVFLHGNPTSSFLWRNIVPGLESRGRCIAPDLIGMGDSEKLESDGPGSYRFVEHREYLDGFLDNLDVSENVTLIIHDWGSALGFDWARRHPEKIKGIAYMEAIVRPLTWDEFPEAPQKVFQGFRSPMGESMVLEKNIFVEKGLPGSIIRELSEDEMGAYRAPFSSEGEGRRPTLTWPREIPIDGEPADVTAIVDDYANWLGSSAIPKLFINAEPGAILIGAQREFCRSWPNQREVTVSGTHFIQEDSPDEISSAINSWLDSIE